MSPLSDEVRPSPTAQQNPRYLPSPRRPGRHAPGRLLECRGFDLDPGPEHSWRPGPRNGQTISRRTPEVRLSLAGAKIVSHTTTRIRPDQAHIHLLVDGKLVASTLDPQSSEDSRAGMRSSTAVRRRLTEATAIEGEHRRVFPQLNPGVVGLAGLEPAASSLSEMDG